MSMELVKYLWVVIRFQVCIFDILNTASSLIDEVVYEFCIFDILNTANITGGSGQISCDSLSSLYL